MIKVFLSNYYFYFTYWDGNMCLHKIYNKYDKMFIWVRWTHTHIYYKFCVFRLMLPANIYQHVVAPRELLYHTHMSILRHWVFWNIVWVNYFYAASIKVVLNKSTFVVNFVICKGLYLKGKTKLWWNYFLWYGLQRYAYLFSISWLLWLQLNQIFYVLKW